MQWKVLTIVLTGLIALFVSGCAASRTAQRTEVRGLRADERDSIRVEQVMVAVHDTIVETKTITITKTETGDTLRLEKTTERDRFSDRAQISNREVEVRVEHDTVYIATRDSVSSSTFQGSRGSSRASPVVLTLKWVFWIIVAVTVLVIVLRFKLFNIFK